MRKDVLYSEKSIMGAKKFQKSGVFGGIMQKTGIAKVLGGRSNRAWGKRAAFYKDVQSKGGGGVTKNELKEVLGDYMQGKSRYFSRKDAYEMGKALFKGERVRYIYRREPKSQGVGSRVNTSMASSSTKPVVPASPAVQMANLTQVNNQSASSPVGTSRNLVEDRKDSGGKKDKTYVPAISDLPDVPQETKKESDGESKVVDLKEYREEKIKSEKPVPITIPDSFQRNGQQGESKSAEKNDGDRKVINLAEFRKENDGENKVVDLKEKPVPITIPNSFPAGGQKEIVKDIKFDSGEKAENEEANVPPEEAESAEKETKNQDENAPRPSAVAQLEKAQNKESEMDYFGSRMPARYTQKTASGKSYFDSMKRVLRYKKAA